MATNIVTNYGVISQIKTCQYFRVNLGLASTIDKGGRRIFNEKDKFSYYYSSQYQTTIYAQGNIGDIKFYVDHFIKDPVIALYSGPTFEEFIFNVDFEMIKTKGIEFWLGHILKQTEEMYEERVQQEELKKMEEKKVGNPDIISINPGAVTYEDLKAYLQKQNNERYKNNQQI